MSILPMVSNQLSMYETSQFNVFFIGGYPKFISQGFNEAYLPVWLQAAGYNTYYTGKLFNVHSVQTYNKPYAAGFTGTVSTSTKSPPELLSLTHRNT